jgi:dipeptidyl aminopeptidase/acylaminoacyl peptidase
MMTRRTLGAACLGAATTAFAQSANATPLIPREILFGNPERAGGSLSPDGKLLAYLAPDTKGVRNVWVRTLGKTDDRVVTSDPKRGISGYFWRGDSQHILYVQDKDGNEDFHVYQTNIATRETRDLTPFDGVRADIVAAEWDHPNEILVSLNKRDKKLFDVHRIDLRSGEVTLDTENPGDVNGWTADNAMQVRAATAILPGFIQEVRIRASRSAPWKPFQKFGPDENFGGVIGFSPDNRSAWVITSVGGNTSRLVEVDPATGQETVIGSDPTYDVTTILANPRTRKLEAVGVLRARLEWDFKDKAVEAEFRALQKQFPGADVQFVSRDFADRLAVLNVSASDAPAKFYLYDRSSKKTEFLYAARPKLDGYQLARMDPIQFQSRDGLTIHGYLTMPLGVKKNAPTVLLVHGGPWGRDSYGYSGLLQMLANRGYAVLQVNFRGSTGYGKQFLNAGDREWAGKMHDDLLDAKKWAVAQGFSDPKRFAIMGGSYGGYATLVGLAFTPEEFTCGVDIVGPSNIVTLLKSIPPYWAPMKTMFDKRVGSLEKDEDFLRARSPLFKADRITKPLLIGQGANDPRVKQPESDQIVKAMRDNRKDVEYIVFADEGHGFQRPDNNLRFMAAAENFLAKHLGGRAEPASAKHDWKPFLK